MQNSWGPPGHGSAPRSESWLSRHRVLAGTVVVATGMVGVGAIVDNDSADNDDRSEPMAAESTSEVTAIATATATIDESTTTSGSASSTTQPEPKRRYINARCTDVSTIIRVDLQDLDAQSGIFSVTFDDDGERVGVARSKRVVMLGDGVRNRFEVPTPRSVGFFTDCSIGLRKLRSATRAEIRAAERPAPSTTTTTTSTTTTTTTTSPPTTLPPDQQLALDVLQFIPVELEQQAGYDRDLR